MYIELHQSIVRHPKVNDLIKELNVSRQSAIGYLVMLWLWALDYAPEGDLSKHNNGRLADAVEFEGNAEFFIQALIKCEFLDQEEDGSLYIHDWELYGGKILKEKMKNAERQRKKREDKKVIDRKVNVPSTSHVGHSDVPVTCDVDKIRKDNIREEKIRKEKSTNSSSLSSSHAIDDENDEKPEEQNIEQTNEFLIQSKDPLVQAYEQLGFGMLNLLHMEQLHDLANTYTQTWVIEAMKEASLNSKRNLKYVNGILKNWHSNGFDEPWKEDKHVQKPSKSNHARNAYPAKRASETISESGRYKPTNKGHPSNVRQMQ